ncbi:hypothetical protein IZ6_23120 [Terrihabitans soli]|uniref:VWFA domain-containing protein n=2 Tax=Terrihabitans soli TaxID=708113 RepID=A0A6S6QUH6_9HYPH|nr:hypothetical protein IZ6_23120 [Terrihabitans soli]
MFAAAVLPIVGTIGFAVDYSRAAEVKAQLVAAVDSTALALAHSSVNLTDAELQKKANDLFKGNFKPGEVSSDGTVKAERGTAQLTVNGSAELKTSFLRVLNISTLDVSAHSKVIWGAKQDIEVVMALDNTGSMAGNKLSELKKAAKELVDTLEANKGNYKSVKIGLVPFASTVRVTPTSNTYKNATWIRFDQVSYEEEVCTTKKKKNGDTYQSCEDVTKTRDFNKSAWQGCIWDRDQPYDVDDTTADTSKSKTLYPAVESCPSSESGLQVVQPMTTDFNKLRTAISNMNAAGTTNVTIGISWGMSLLSNQKPFDQGSAATTGDNAAKKYLIILTDGENTKNRFTTNTATIDARTKLACKAAHDMGTIFTIRMIDGDESLLKACASDPANYYNVEQAADVSTAFRAIGNDIGGLRVAE